MIRRLALLIVVAMLTVACPVQQIAQVEIAPVEVAAGEPSPGPTDGAASPEPVEEPSPVSEPSPGESDDPADADVLSDGETQTPPPTEPPPPPPSPDPANRPPLASDVRVSTEEDKAILVDAAANDVDPDGDPLFVSLESPPRNGKLAVSGDVLSYTPNANYHGSDSFTYRVSDGKGGSDVGTVAITITPVNDRPDARDDMLSVSEDTSGQVNVLANDVDVDGDALTAKLVSGPANGKVTQSGGTFTYTPNGNYIGDDSFTYDAVDPSGVTDRATVKITVGGVNDRPVAADDTLTLDEDTNKSVNVLANDRDPDGDSLTVSIVSGPGKGKASVDGGMISYTPNANVNGSDELTYQVSDGNGGTDTARVAITINPVNDRPIAVFDRYRWVTNCGGAVTINVLANDSDPDGDAVTVTGVGKPGLGTATFDSTSVRYTPPSSWTGVTSTRFDYTISDGSLTATETVLVELHHCPIARSDSMVIQTGFSARTLTFNVITGAQGSGWGGGDTFGGRVDTDPDGHALTMVTTGALDSRLTCQSNGNCTLSVEACGRTGVITLNYTIQDSEGARATTTVSYDLNDACIR